MPGLEPQTLVEPRVPYVARLQEHRTPVGVRLLREPAEHRRSQSRAVGLGTRPRNSTYQCGGTPGCRRSRASSRAPSLGNSPLPARTSVRAFRSR